MQYLYDLYQFFTGVYHVVCARCHYDKYLPSDTYDCGPATCGICNRPTSYMSKKAYTESHINTIRNTVFSGIPIIRDTEDERIAACKDKCSLCNIPQITSRISGYSATVPSNDITVQLQSVIICSDCVTNEEKLTPSDYIPSSYTLHCTLCDVPLSAKYRMHTACLLYYRTRITQVKKNQ